MYFFMEENHLIEKILNRIIILKEFKKHKFISLLIIHLNIQKHMLIIKN